MPHAAIAIHAPVASIAVNQTVAHGAIDAHQDSAAAFRAIDDDREAGQNRPVEFNATDW